MAYDKASNELGALWQGTSKRGTPYWSGTIDMSHAPEEARLLANALMSGAKVKVMIFENNFKNPKAPTHSIVMPQEQLDFLQQNYQQVLRLPPGDQPDYREYEKQRRDEWRAQKNQDNPPQPNSAEEYAKQKGLTGDAPKAQEQPTGGDGISNPFSK